VKRLTKSGVGGHINDRLWQGFWDFVFVVSSFLLAVLFGAAAGNLARGVPLDARGNFSMAFFTNFRVHGYVGLLDWYTISVAIFAVAILAAFDSGAREFVDRIFRCIQPEWSFPRCHLVACSVHTRGDLFHLHLASLQRESQRSPRQSGLLLGVLTS